MPAHATANDDVEPLQGLAIWLHDHDATNVVDIQVDLMRRKRPVAKRR